MRDSAIYFCVNAFLMFAVIIREGDISMASLSFFIVCNLWLMSDMIIKSIDKKQTDE